MASFARAILSGLLPRMRVVLLALSAAHVLPLFAQDMPVPVQVQASLLPKILSFERQASKQSRSVKVIGILFQSNVRTSLVCAKEFAEAIPRFMQSDDGTPVECRMMEFSSKADLLSELNDDSGIDLIYVTPLRSVDIGAIGRVLQSHRLLSYTGVPAYVDAGLALGVDVAGNRPKIVVNLPVARVAGAEFSSQLLKISRVVE